MEFVIFYIVPLYSFSLIAHLADYIATLDIDVSSHEVFIHATTIVEHAHLPNHLTKPHPSHVDLLVCPSNGAYFAGGKLVGYGNHKQQSHQDDPWSRQWICAKPINPDSKTKLLSFGYDVMSYRVVSLHKRALVGRWYFSDLQYKHVIVGSIKMIAYHGVQSKWSPIMSCLMNDWYNFHLLHQEDLDKI